MLLSGVVGAVAFEIDRQVGMYMEDRLSRGPASAATSGSLGMPAHQSVILGELSSFLKDLDPNLPQRSDEAFRIARDLMKYEAALHQGLRAEGLRAEDGKMDELVESLRTLRGKLITSEPGLRSSIANAQAMVSDMQR